MFCVEHWLGGKLLLSSNALAMDWFNIAYRNKIDGFSVVYQFHQGCGLSIAFRKNYKNSISANLDIFAFTPVHQTNFFNLITDWLVVDYCRA